MHPLRGTASFKGMFSFLLKGTFSFLLKGGRFLFLKKRNKRHCGTDDFSAKRCFPARPARYEKRTVHIRTVRFVLHVGESNRSAEKKLSRSRFSFASFLLKRKEDGSHTNRPFCVARWRKRQKRRRKTFPHSTFFCVVGLHGKAGAQARRTRAETRRRREAYPLWYSDRRQRRMCLRPSV